MLAKVISLVIFHLKTFDFNLDFLVFLFYIYFILRKVMRYFIRVGLALIRLSPISPLYDPPHRPNGGETFINEWIISSG